MFVAVIVGNLLAVLFAFCGIVCVGGYVCGDKAASSAAFAQGLAESAWPLGVAGSIYLLVQIACLLEKLHLQRAEISFVPTPLPKKASPVENTKNKQEPVSESGRFFKADSPLPPPSPPPAPTPETQTKQNKDSDTTSLIPTPVAAEKETAPPKKPAHSLNFFRVD